MAARLWLRQVVPGGTDTATLQVFGTYPAQSAGRPPISWPTSGTRARWQPDWDDISGDSAPGLAPTPPPIRPPHGTASYDRHRTFRLATGGRLIDRAAPRGFRFDGRRMDGLAGDTLASALLANGQLLMGRSFKYHRPRGPIASGVEEPNALLGLGQGARFEPNQRATTTPLVAGMVRAARTHGPA